jgi:DNA-binding MarR family transcriptional regulator
MQRLQATIDGGPVQRCAREILDTVPPVIWFIRREMRAFRKELSLPQFRALALVHRTPAASLSAVADHLGSSLPSASRLIQGLVEKGLMKRTGCPKDRRQLALAITDVGEEALDLAWSGTQDRLTDELHKLSADQLQCVADAMHSLKELFGTSGLYDEAEPKSR